MSDFNNVNILIEYCTRGDSAAWLRFNDDFSHLILQSIKNKVKKLCFFLNESEIRDIYQQLLLSIWQKQKLAKIKNPNNIIPWLIKVAENKTFDYLKSKQRTKEITGIYETKAYSAPEQLDQTHNNQLYKDIENFINSLSLKNRRMAILDLLYNLKYKQISEILNLPIGTVSPAVKRIKTDLKRYLFKKGYKIKETAHV